ncbi:MAG TPA: PTS glucitol/sorbitol transporter subunit IIA [Thermoflexales bacterium]|jgi:PTS system glucitol/sorbitol-specific IIA component|nr:PTS glucitol/sorbitol transporter subunit IIA [Anaerolineae bacterium]HQV27467.1 PTS glucitol/sorbitol transporter subunit IIA [Thermoflexales bacterium]HQX09950.1 PTS glucitol/sorbitol transporter subunit IIA [Thermoflexales bacterium]HQY23345.1 PTS glucitol/sorbitol transporter subunit IIA [Thermoflexales bacterium]HQZ52688.1 PTS glucitol/sorbitol transporter subunit IIA [Thermoflexales bacterium]
MALKYDRRVTSVGELINEFVSAGILIFFGAGAPEELAEFSVIHEGPPLLEPVAPGDVVTVAGETYTVLAVGDVANTNLANLGHLVLKANGLDAPELPGDVCVEAKPFPAVGVGDTFSIASPER